MTIEKLSTPLQSPYTDPSMMESETDKSFSQSTLQQTSQKHLRTNDAAILQREKEINDIAKGIIELADIFRELQNMVIDQGTMLDRIDYNIERMAKNVKGADKELVVVSKEIRICVDCQPCLLAKNRLLATKRRLPSGRFCSCSSSWLLACSSFCL